MPAGLYFSLPRNHAELAKQPRELGKLVAGIEAAWVRQNPDAGAANPFRLFTEAYTSGSEGKPIRADA
jgi:hypothetical protein